MLKNNVYNKLVLSSILGVVLFFTFFSFSYNLYAAQDTSTDVVAFSDSSDLNFTTADDSKGFLFISEKDELEFREKDTIITLTGFSYTAFFAVLDFKLQSFFIPFRYFIVRQLALYDVFCSWKIPSIASIKM